MPSPLVGEPVPEFRFLPVRGRTLGLSPTVLRREVSLVKVLAAWCTAWAHALTLYIDENMELLGDARPSEALLPADEAFRISVGVRDATTLVADLAPAKHYALYRDRTEISRAEPARHRGCERRAAARRSRRIRVSARSRSSESRVERSSRSGAAIPVAAH